MTSTRLGCALLGGLIVAQSLTTAQTIVRRLVSCNPKALAGQEICVCSENVGTSLAVVLLDGRQIAVTSAQRYNGIALANVPDVFHLRLPGDLTPGEHWITAPSPIGGRVRIEVVLPRIEINLSKLRRGQVARVRFVIEGTKDVVKVTLRNTTPGVVTLLDENGQPANEQTVDSSGGDSNEFLRSVRADNVGDFVIASELDLGSCPCGDGRLTEGPRQPGGVEGPPIGVTPGGGPILRLGILLTRDDDQWIPAPAANPPSCPMPTIGTDKTSLTARLYQNAGTGWQPTTIERLVTIFFTKRSKETGKALNIRTSGPEPADLIFLPFHATSKDEFACEADQDGRNGKCQTLLPVSQTTIDVLALDFGAYGRADASCRDCAKLTRDASGAIVDATAGGAAAATDVTVPKDDNGNNIADAYVWDSLGRMTDEDAAPGSAIAGDGLTNYEEYRGFGVKGCHVRTSPELKDLFVENAQGADFSLFRAASGVAVWEIHGGEYDGQHVVNFNRGPDSSVGEQHGIRFDVGMEGGMVDLGAQGNCSIGPPKNVKRCAALPGSTADVFAHELGHGVGMRHHGEIANEALEVIQTGNAVAAVASTVLPGMATRVNATSFCSKSLNPNTTTTFLLAHRGDQGSGDRSCIMAYPEHGDLVTDGTAPLGYCCTAKPSVQDHFCDGATGTGQNANGACRGDASVGNCKAQLHVNDTR